jgi:hypothetical protein
MTALIKQAVRDAREVLERTGDPLVAADRLLYFVEGAIAARLQRRFQNKIADLPLNEFVVMRDGLLQVAKQRERLASFMHAKLRPAACSNCSVSSAASRAWRVTPRSPVATSRFRLPRPPNAPSHRSAAQSTPVSAPLSQRYRDNSNQAAESSIC